MHFEHGNSCAGVRAGCGRRGFRIIDPSKTDVRTIAAACAGARAVVGIEGSHLAHGARQLRAGGNTGITAA